MKAEIKELIEYLWYDELKDYQRHLFEDYGESVLEEFDKIDLENKDEVDFWLKTEYGADHIFITLIKLNIETNGEQ